MPFVGIGNILGGGSAISYAKQLAKAYQARVIADGGVVESLGCFTAFAKALGAFKPTLLLDFYQNAAAAYSLRKLSTTYTGDAIRVRRASDNTEQDIGFVSNELDTATLESFCSGTDGFVTTWYDQSGNGYDASQTTAASQPQIVSSGSVILENGKPSIDFNGTSDFLQTSTLSISQPYSFFDVIKGDVLGTVAFIRTTSTSSPALIYVGTDVIRINAGVNLDSAIGTRDTNQTLLSTLYDSTTSYIYKNATILKNGNAGIQSYNNIRIGSPSFSGQRFDGKYQELILYPSDQSSNRTGIETNINNFYSIY